MYNPATLFTYSLSFFMKKYELMMIIDPKLEAKALEALIADLRSELDVHGLAVENEVVWGVRDMAYKINSSKQGYYLIYTLSTSEPRKILGLDEAFSIKKGLWRHLLTTLPH